MPKVHLGSFYAEVDDEKELTMQIKMDLCAMVFEARNRLASAVLWRGTRSHNSEVFKRCVNTYFRNDFTPDSDDREVVQAYDRVVNSAVSGLMTIQREIVSNELTLYCRPRGKMDAAAGMVIFSVPSVLKDTISGPDPGRAMGTMGLIRINYNDIGAKVVAAHTLIHEASHKWLGTRDWGYHYGWDMLGYESSWREMGGDVPPLDFVYPKATRGPRTEGKNYPSKVPDKGTSALKAWYEMSGAEALNNADSYSGFAVRVSEIDLAPSMKPLLGGDVSPSRSYGTF